MTIGALVSGITSRRRLAVEEGVARRWLRAHMALGPAFFGGLLAITSWRAVLWLENASLPLTYLVALGALVGLMTVQGFLGGEIGRASCRERV